VAQGLSALALVPALGFAAAAVALPAGLSLLLILILVSAGARRDKHQRLLHQMLRLGTRNQHG